MQEDLSTYARIGLTHFMLWLDCVQDESVFTDTLPAILDRSDIEVIDYSLPYDPSLRAAMAQAVRDSGKEPCYIMFPIPLMEIPPGSPADNHQAINRLLLQDQIDAAVASGARQMVFATGPDPGEAERPEWQCAFAELTRWFCHAAKPHGITINLEPFDRETDRRFLYGPTEECVELIESLAPDVDNLRLLLDTSHVRLMGETFEHAVRTASRHLGRVHLANCIMRDRSDPLFGDRHPPFGYPGGEIDVPELAEIFRTLLDAGCLSPQNRMQLVIEIQPWAGRSVEDTVTDNMDRLHRAWAQA